MDMDNGTWRLSIECETMFDPHARCTRPGQGCHAARAFPPSSNELYRDSPVDGSLRDLTEVLAYLGLKPDRAIASLVVASIG
jgi:hypothetical protein